MAIYSLNLGFISRSAGRSSVGFSAYISGSRQKDARTGKGYNYTRKEDVVVSRVLAPEGTPDWVLNPAMLWNHVEQGEDDIANLRFRPDPKDTEKTQKTLAFKEKFLHSSQTAQTVMGAIPLELNQNQAEACVEEFLKSRFVSRNLVVHYALHWDSGNPHFHALVTRRPLVGGEFSLRKDREIVSRAEHKITRKAWEVIANKHLALAGHDIRIDCRSHKERGSLFEPGVHEGFWAQRLAERGEASRLVENNEGIRQKNIEILCDHPETLIHEVSQKRTVFTRKHIEDEIIRRVGGDEKLFRILKERVEGLENLELSAPNENFADALKAIAVQLTNRILDRSEVIHSIGDNINRDAVFTSTAYKVQEEKIVGLADVLHQRSSKTLSEAFITKALTQHEEELVFTLSPEQQEAIHHLCSGPDIRILNGRAGTGKTTLLKAVAEAYQAAGYNVLGTSFQGKAVEIMQREIGIPCKTLDSLKFTWERHDRQKSLVESGKLWGRPYLYAFQKMKDLEQSRFTTKDVILVDEANMIGGQLWEVFLEEATRKGAKVLIIQDKAQIKSREPGDYGRLFAERFGTAETRDVMRQRVDWQKECSVALNDGRILDGLKPYQDKGHLQWCETIQNTRESIVEVYLKDHSPDQTRIVLAYRNRDVEALNQVIRIQLKSQGVLGASFAVAGKDFSVGDRIRFTQNDHQGLYVKNAYESFFQTLKERWSPTLPQGVKNGTFGTVLSGNAHQMKIQLDDGRCVKLNPAEYPHLTHGYALGIHKSEGSTFDRTFVALDPLLDSSMLLVAMTRHRLDAQAFVNREEVIDFKALVEKIGRGSSKEMLHDYHVSEAQKPYLERVQAYRDLLIESMNLREEMEGSLKAHTPLYKHPSYSAYQACLAQKKELANEILENWDSHKPYTQLAGIRRDALEVEAGLRPRTLSDLEHRASIQAQSYRELVQEARGLWKSIAQTHPPVLAKTHTLYEDYQKLKFERDSLASVFQENPKLYRPFFKVTQDGEGNFKDYWGHRVEDKDRFLMRAIPHHAKAHLERQKQKAFEERLSVEEQEAYQTVQAYKDVSREATALHHLLKTGSDKEFWTREMLQHRVQQACSKRDILAFQTSLAMPEHQFFLTALKNQEEKLLIHASGGELREKVRAYHSEKDIQVRAEKAIEIQALSQSATSSQKRILKEESLDLQRIRFDVVYAEKLKEGAISPKENPEFIYNHLRDYREASRQVGRAWIQETRSSKPQAWEEALQYRHEAAERLLSHESARLLFQALHPEKLEKLKAHACHPSTTQKQTPFHRFGSVLEAFRGRTHEIAEDMLGVRNIHLSTKTTLRFGSNGKIAVHIGGEKEGLWHDFSSGTGGNIFQLIQQQKGLGFREAVDYGAWFVGLSDTQKTTFSSSRGAIGDVVVQRNGMATSSHHHDAEREKRLAAVSDLHEKSQEIKGSLAETYLRQERGIQGVLPEDLRFLPKATTFSYNDEHKTLAHDCFAAFGRNAAGDLSSVQFTKLNENGTRAYGKDGQKLNKIQYGVSKGAFVILQNDPINNRIFIAEGVETALSIKEAGVQGTIVASLGIHNIKNYEGPKDKIILCADNDGPHARTNAVIEHAQKHFQAQSKTVVVIRPTQEGQDFNDVLREKSVSGTQKCIQSSLVQSAGRGR